MKQKYIYIFFNSLAFSMIQWILPIWPLVSLPFINPVWTSSISRFMCCWNLAWRIVSMPLFNSVQLLSRVWLFVTPMDCSTPGLLVHYQLLEFTQTHVHWVGDAIQPSHPLSSPSPPALNLSQHQGLFKWVSSSHQVAKVLKFQL